MPSRKCEEQDKRVAVVSFWRVHQMEICPWRLTSLATPDNYCWLFRLDSITAPLFFKVTEWQAAITGSRRITVSMRTSHGRSQFKVHAPHRRTEIGKRRPVFPGGQPSSSNRDRCCLIPVRELDLVTTAHPFQLLWLKIYPSIEIKRDRLRGQTWCWPKLSIPYTKTSINVDLEHISY